MIQIDMEMPKNCKFCPLHDVNPDQCPIRTIYKDDYATSRFTDCPLYKIAEDTDTISRQAAIDAECEVCQIAPKKERGHNCTYYVHGCKEIECLRELPPAQPEKRTEERTKTHACDLISRQAAIDAMENVDWYHISKDGRLVHGANSDDHEPLYKAKDVYAVLNTMPSAQPKRTEKRTETHGVCLDAIDRQAAIDAWKNDFKGYINALDMPKDDYNGIMEYIDEFPSAQPKKRTEERTETHACDLIDRQAAIDAFKPYADYESNRTNADWVRRIELVLHDLPSAQPEPQWIPVAERLPENKQEVLVTEYGDTDIGRRFNGRWLDRYGDKMKDVTAWMEKPEPYAERRTDG